MYKYFHTYLQHMYTASRFFLKTPCLSVTTAKPYDIDPGLPLFFHSSTNPSTDRPLLICTHKC